MKIALLSFLVLYSFSATAQQTTPEALEQEAKTNKRLLPKYGHLPKTESELTADKKFIETTVTLPQFNGNYTAASNHMIKLGFDYLYRGELKTAMYRFNQAYLLDSTNAEIYWGYGAYYMTLGKYAEGQKQYLEGLSRAPDNTHLLTDYATWFLSQYYGLMQGGLGSDAVRNLDSAIVYLKKSFDIDGMDQNTSYKLSVSYLAKGDCPQAWEYFDKCLTLGGRPITKEFSAALKKKCKKRN